MIFGPLLTAMNTSYGWRNSLRILSGIVFLFGMVAATPFLKSPKTRQRQAVDSRANDPSPTASKKCTNDENGKGSINRGSCDRDFPSCNHQDLASIERTNITRPRPPSGCGLLSSLEVWFWILSTTFANLGWSFVVVNFVSIHNLRHVLPILITVIHFEITEYRIRKLSLRQSICILSVRLHGFLDYHQLQQ